MSFLCGPNILSGVWPCLAQFLCVAPTHRARRRHRPSRSTTAAVQWPITTPVPPRPSNIPSLLTPRSSQSPHQPPVLAPRLPRATNDTSSPPRTTSQTSPHGVWMTRPPSLECSSVRAQWLLDKNMCRRTSVNFFYPRHRVNVLPVRRVNPSVSPKTPFQCFQFVCHEKTAASRVSLEA